MFNGDLIQNTKYFEPEYYESDEQYMIKLIPEDRKIRMYITEIVLKFNRTTLVLNNMETLDKSGNLGVMKFHDVQENIEIENSIFSNF